LKRKFVLSVAFNVAVELILPKLDASFRHCCLSTPGMAMPEAPVNEYCCFVLWQHNIGSAWQPVAMKPKPQPALVKHPSNGHFGAGMLALYGPHDFPPHGVDGGFLFKFWRAE
jgi:hypothetical protein